MNRFVALALQASLAVAFWVADYYYPDPYLVKGFMTFLALTVTYLVFRVILEENFVRRIKEPKTKYSARKVASILYVLVFAAVVMRIWIEDSQALLVSYGIIGAGIAISLQDFFKNFVGGLLIFVSGVYRTGDRIEIDSQHGDVIDVGILYTTLLELRGWIDGDQATGRLTVVPNGRVLSGVVHNYTKDHNFIWDELRLPLTYDSDWRGAVEAITSIFESETRGFVERARTELSQIMNKYYLSERVLRPVVYITLTDNWIELHIRYITDFSERRAIHDRLSRLLLEYVEKSDKVRIASESISITEFPELVTRTEARKKAGKREARGAP